MKSSLIVTTLAMLGTPQIALADSGGQSSHWSRSASYTVTDSLAEANIPITDFRTDTKTLADGPFERSVSINQDLSSLEGGSAGTETHAKAISSFAKMGVAISGASFAHAAGFSGQTTAQATASFKDTLLFHAETGAAAGPFTFHYRLKLDGISSANAIGKYSPDFTMPNHDYINSYGSVTLTLAGTGIFGGLSPRTLSRRTVQYANTTIVPPIDIIAPTFIDGSIEMFDDVPMDIFQTLSISGYAATANFDQVLHQSGSASFDGNYAHTLSFLSGAYFTDSDGNIVNDFTLSSASGFDYLHPQTAGAVPEPAMWAMMVCGFGLVGGALRARRTVSPAIR